MNEPTNVAREEQVVRLIELKSWGRCHSCCAPVRWARTIAGAMMPLQDEPPVRALGREPRQRVTIRVGSKPGVARHQVCKTKADEEKLVAIGYAIRDEVYDVWEVAASLTHWPHCTGADKHRKPKGEG